MSFCDHGYYSNDLFCAMLKIIVPAIWPALNLPPWNVFSLYFSDSDYESPLCGFSNVLLLQWWNYIETVWWLELLCCNMSYVVAQIKIMHNVISRMQLWSGMAHSVIVILDSLVWNLSSPECDCDSGWPSSKFKSHSGMDHITIAFWARQVSNWA